MFVLGEIFAGAGKLSGCLANDLLNFDKKNIRVFRLKTITPPPKKKVTIAIGSLEWFHRQFPLSSLFWFHTLKRFRGAIWPVFFRSHMIRHG